MEKTVRYDSFGELYSAINQAFDINRTEGSILIATAKQFCPADYKDLELEIENRGKKWTITAEDFFFVNRLYFCRTRGINPRVNNIHLHILNMGRSIGNFYLGIDKDFVEEPMERKRRAKEYATKGCQIIIGREFKFNRNEPLSRKETEIVKSWDLGEIVDVCLR